MQAVDPGVDPALISGRAVRHKWLAYAMGRIGTTRATTRMASGFIAPPVSFLPPKSRHPAPRGLRKHTGQAQVVP
jgi:hypothetical protein